MRPCFDNNAGQAAAVAWAGFAALGSRPENCHNLMLWGGHDRVRDFLAIGGVLLVGAARRLLRLNGGLAGGAAGVAS